jgi:DNA-binding MarR family transcriptional regulator
MSPHPDPPSLDFLLAQVSRLHYHRAHELLEKLGLYRGQPPVLFTLWEHDGMTHSELAQSLEITPATITRMVQRMEKAGFVHCKPDEDDQRVSRVYLTDAGRTVRTELQAVWDRMEVENFLGFGADELVVLRGLLSRIRENLIQATEGKSHL